VSFCINFLVQQDMEFQLHMQKGTGLSPFLLFSVVLWGENLGTRLGLVTLATFLCLDEMSNYGNSCANELTKTSQSSVLLVLFQPYLKFCSIPAVANLSFLITRIHLLATQALGIHQLYRAFSCDISRRCT